MSRYFHIDRGISNYEEVIDLDKIVFWGCAWALMQDGKTWSAEISLRLDGGHTAHISLTRSGYVEFIKAVGGEALYQAYKESGGKDE